VIRRQFGIRYHPSHVWKLLTARGWRCQPFELSEAEKQTLLRMLARGPRRASPRLDRWIFGRLVEVFRQEFGSQLHPRTGRVALPMLANPPPDRPHPKHPKHDRWAGRWERVGSETFPEECRPRGLGRMYRPPGDSDPTRADAFPESLIGFGGTYR